MFNIKYYIEILLSITQALITLLGSVGIFVSLIIQRRVERLQAILEEFMDLSYHEDTNLSGKMFRLIEKYQMQYQLPNQPSTILVKYIDLTILIVIISWTGVLFIDYRKPFMLTSLWLALPIITGLAVMVFFRYLLKNVVNPVGNSMLSPFIPPPAKLRSVSYLSRYVNVSVKSILKHARLRVVIKENNPGDGIVILKEEISFDNYFYFLQVSECDNRLFTGFGEVTMDFGHEPVTGKPIPAVRNVNIPLGRFDFNLVREKDLTVVLLIFSIGEKHPIQYKFHLHRYQNMFQTLEEPEISINYMITYQVKNNFLHLLQLETEIPDFLKFRNFYQLNQQRFYYQKGKNNNNTPPEKFNKPIYID